jgi:hypothetical protein
MKKAIIAIVLAITTVVWGNVIELPLNCEGTYDINTPYWTTDFDLGVTFSEISHVYVDWAGGITAGLAVRYTDPCNLFPLEVGIRAAFSFPFRYVAVWGGEESYHSPELFDSLFEIKSSTWSDLLDGQGTINIQFEELIMTNGRYIKDGSVMLNDATLVVEGTIVPEPTSLLLFALGGLFLKRGRK